MARADDVHAPDATATGRAETPMTVERVAVVGSSAGGLEALSALLASLPPELPVAYVIAQHLAADHESQMVPLLARATTLPVVVATDGAPLMAGVVLVTPPNVDVRVSKDCVQISEPGTSAGPNPSIDLLMRSAAVSRGNEVVGIVLSGTGTDGSAGLRAIQEHGGLTIAQRPETAQFEAMPQAAIATGAADLVLGPGEIGSALAHTPKLPLRMLADPVRRPPTPGGTDVTVDIVAALRFATGLDFTGYKRGTLERQIAHRQSLTRTPDPAQYCALVASGGDEADALARSLMVTVTSFFRDPEAWERLRAVLTEEWRDRDQLGQVRIWVPGCATGEEAYTVAIVAAGILGVGSDLSTRLKIFATDLSNSALEVGRRGRYSDYAAASIPPELRERWLRHDGADWEVVPPLRDAVIFARHNVAQDPPFPRIDLICFRNTLIYFRAPLQAQVLNYCHFALAEGGLLFLGSSERPSGAKGLFDVVDDRRRIYRRSTGAFSGPLPVSGRGDYTAQERGPEQPPLSPEMLRELLIAQLAPPALVLDANDEVIEVIGDVSPWCRVAPGPPNMSAVSVVREELRPLVQALLIQVRHAGADERARSLVTPRGDARLELRRLGPERAHWILLTFNPVWTNSQAAAPPRAAASRTGVGIADVGGAEVGSAVDEVPTPESTQAQLRQVEAELDHTRSALQATVDDLSTSNEELRAMNEELQASTEELQASGEEIQATNEELQATNEELTVLNSELGERSTDLEALNQRLENIARSPTSGMVVLNRELRVTQFTPLAVRLFVLIDEDLGRPLTAIVTTTPVPELERHLRESLDNGVRSVIEVRGESADFLVAFQPYLQRTKESGGVIVVVTDVTDLARTRRELEQVQYRYRLVAENSTDAVFFLDHGGIVRWVSPAVEYVLGYKPEDLVGSDSADRVHPDDLSLASADRDRLEHGAWATQHEIRVMARGGQYRWMSKVSGPARDSNGTVVGRIVTLRDINDQVLTREKLAQQVRQLAEAGEALQESQWELEQAQRVAHVGSWTLDLATDEVWWSRELYVMSGLDPDQPAPKLSAQGTMFSSKSWEQLKSAIAATVATRVPYSLELAVIRPDGSHGWMLARGEVQLDADVTVAGLRGVAMDITETRATSDALARTAQTFRLAMEGAPQGMAVIGLHLRFLNVNPMLCDMLGRDEAWLLSHTLRDVIHPDDLDADLSERDELISGGAELQVHERRWLRADGSNLWVIHSTALQRDSEGVPLFYISHVQDSSDAHRVSELLASRANQDPLTGLLNRVQLEAHLADLASQTRARPTRTAVLFCDLDDFKAINDRFGHQAGDETLRATAERITSCLRAEDVVARVGGDEFVVVLDSVTGEADAIGIAEKIRTAVCQPLPIPNEIVILTISIGIGTSAPDMDPHRLLRNSDSAMYRAKQAGRDRVEVYMGGSTTEAEKRTRSALDQGQFRPWFQPIVDLESGAVIGYEALARWCHHDGSISVPGDFLANAELSDAVTLLDITILDQSIRAMKQLGDQAFVSVNVSAITLASPHYVEQVLATVAGMDFDPTRLHLEFTETALLAVTSRVADAMRRISDAGVSWYVDDFGTGFSSIAHLRDLPISGLKLDISFTAGVESDDPVCQHLARGLAGLAEGLDLDTVAEGVETEKQAEFLLASGWKRGQGWLYGHPEEVAALS